MSHRSVRGATLTYEPRLTNFSSVIRDPKESNFYPWEKGGFTSKPRASCGKWDDRRDSVSLQVYRPDRPGYFILSG